MSGSVTLAGGWVVRWFVAAGSLRPMHPAARMSWALFDPSGRVALGDACEVRYWPARFDFLTRSASAGAL